MQARTLAHIYGHSCAPARQLHTCHLVIKFSLPHDKSASKAAFTFHEPDAVPFVLLYFSWLLLRTP